MLDGLGLVFCIFAGAKITPLMSARWAGISFTPSVVSLPTSSASTSSHSTFTGYAWPFKSKSPLRGTSCAPSPGPFGLRPRLRNLL